MIIIMATLIIMAMVNEDRGCGKPGYLRRCVSEDDRLRPPPKEADGWASRGRLERARPRVGRPRPGPSLAGTHSKMRDGLRDPPQEHPAQSSGRRHATPRTGCSTSRRMQGRADVMGPSALSYRPDALSTRQRQFPSDRPESPGAIDRRSSYTRWTATPARNPRSGSLASHQTATCNVAAGLPAGSPRRGQ